MKKSNVAKSENKKNEKITKISHTWDGVARNFLSIESDLTHLIAKATQAAIQLIDETFSETLMMLANRPAVKIKEMIRETDERMDRFFSKLSSSKTQNLQHQIEVSRFDDEGGAYVATTSPQ